jgi:hypothetical protein
MSTNLTPDPICCPPFDLASWNEKTIIWENKHFIRDKVCTLFYMPLNFGGAMKRLMTKVEKAGAQVPDWICLSDHTSKWNMDLYLAVDKEIAGTENIFMSGKMLCKVYEGPFKDTGKWAKDFDAYTAAQKVNVDKLYMWYTTCPKCAKKYGKNYVVFIARLT